MKRLKRVRLKLKVYNFLASTKVLGPFERSVLWVQGCPFNCKNCMTPDSIDLNGGIEIDVEFLVEKIAKLDVEGITISGGEPFLQHKELNELISKIRNIRDFGVIVYTGYKFEEIKNLEFIKNIDILIDGEYIEELNDGIALRGSSNQKVYFLTDRYKDFENLYNSYNRQVEIKIDETIEIIGIPSINTLKRFK